MSLKDKTREKASDVRDDLEYKWGMAEAAQRDIMGDNRGQTQTVITGLVIVIVAFLAIIVVDQFDTSLGDPQSSELNNSSTDVLQGFADMTSLIGPLLLVLIAAVIIGVVQRVRA